ncbi:MAG TPA: phage holin family protein [Actinomycetota bacterium]|nr:phage holin family protein [Actinomycetota bacterium]
MSQQTGTGSNGQVTDKSAGQLMKEVTEDLSTLFRKEIELAKQEVGKAIGDKVKGAVIIAIAGTLAFFALIFMLLAIRDGFDNILPTWLADIVTAAVLLVIGAVGALIAKSKLTSPINADMTKQTIKDDVQMVKSLGRS